MTKKNEVLRFCREMRRLKTSQVIRWGLDNYHTRAERDVRELAEEGLIWRMRSDLKEKLYPKSREDVWSVLPEDRNGITFKEEKIGKQAQICF